MSIKNKLKISIGLAAVLIIALYTYCLFAYGGEYLNGAEYIIQTGIIVLFSIPVILVAKFFIPQKIWVASLEVGIITILGVIVLSIVTGKGVRYIAEMMVIGLWPMFCYAVTKKFNIGAKIGFKSSVINFLGYNIVMAGLIWLLEEVVFKYSNFSVDVIAEMYLYVVALIAFFVYNVKFKRNDIDKWAVVCFVVIVGTMIYLWVCNQGRISEIIESVKHGKTDVDIDGEYKNWISHRISMLKVVFGGDFSNILIYRIHPMVEGCALAWLSGVGGSYIPVVILMLNIVMTCLMIVYARKNKSILMTIATISFVLKFVIGLTTNLFLIYSTSVGVPFVRNVYDIIVLIMVFLICEKCKTHDVDEKVQ